MAKNNKKNNKNNKKAQAQVKRSNAGKVNWGVLRDAEHAEIMANIKGWSDVRKQMALDNIAKNGEIEALRSEERYKGHVIDGQYIVNKPGKKHDANAVDYQTEYNEKEEAIVIKYRELLKERRAEIAEIYKGIGLDKHLFESYQAYIEVDGGEEEHKAYLTEMEAFLKLGLKVPFGEKGLKYAAYELVKGIGKKFYSIGAAYRKDRDADAFKKSDFQSAVMANLRSILQDKGIIAICPIEDENENKKSNSKPKSKTNSKKDKAVTIEALAELAGLTIENKADLPAFKEATKVEAELPEAGQAKIKNRNRGVKNRTTVKAKEKATKKSKKETVAA